MCCEWQVIRGDFVASEQLIEAAVQGNWVLTAFSDISPRDNCFNIQWTDYSRSAYETVFKCLLGRLGPNKSCLDVCVSVHSFVHNKFFPGRNKISYADWSWWVIRDSMLYDLIQGHG